MAAYQLNTIKEMLPHICCGFVETKSCVKQQLSNTCGSKAEPGGSAAAGYMSQLADAMGKEMVGVACARHTTPGKCDHLEPLPVPANLTSVLRDQFEHEFIVMPFIRVSERMVKSD